LSAALAWWEGLEARPRFWGFLLDGPWGGGEGRVFDWSDLAETLKLSDYRAVKDRLILAGGLTADNVTEAIRCLRPQGVDVATGVEAGPGVKDHDAVRRFVASARQASMG
jgi:phosphoribosylanthranilate isomerase